MTHTKRRRDLFLRVLRLLLVLLLAQSAGIRWGTGSPPLGMLAYLKGSDLWVKPLPDGQARQVTAGGNTMSPRWSPSGQWLVYHKDCELRMVRSSGADTRTVSPKAKVNIFAWSPVSDTLAYTTRTGSLWVVSANDWRERELIASAGDQPGFGVLSMAWSPDGEWLTYGREDVVKEGQPPDRYAALWRMRIDGSGAEELFNTGTPAQDGFTVARWSPDSQHILFWPVRLFSPSLLADGTSLMVIPANGGQPMEPVHSMLARDDFLAWSPDGKLLAITVGEGRETWSHKRIALVELTSGQLTYLTDEKIAAFSPVWSPDGQRLAYVAAPDIGFGSGGEVAKAGAAKRRIWVMKRDGSEKRQLTHDAAYRDERPLWSADGSHLLFVRLDQSGRASLWLMRDDGSEEQRVADLSPAPDWFGYYGYISWDGYFNWWLGAPRRP